MATSGCPVFLSQVLPEEIADIPLLSQELPKEGVKDIFAVISLRHLHGPLHREFPLQPHGDHSVGYTETNAIRIFDNEAPASNGGQFIHGKHAIFSTKASGIYLVQEGLSGSKVVRGSESFALNKGSRLSLNHGDIITFGSNLKNPLAEYNYLSFEVLMPHGETYGTGPRTNLKKRDKSTNATEKRSTGELKRNRTDGNKVENVMQKAAEKALRKAAQRQRKKKARQSRERAGQRTAAGAASKKRQGAKRQSNRYAAGQVAHKRKIKTKGGCTLNF